VGYLSACAVASWCLAFAFRGHLRLDKELLRTSADRSVAAQTSEVRDVDLSLPWGGWTEAQGPHRDRWGRSIRTTTAQKRGGQLVFVRSPQYESLEQGASMLVEPLPKRYPCYHATGVRRNVRQAAVCTPQHMGSCAVANVPETSSVEYGLSPWPQSKRRQPSRHSPAPQAFLRVRSTMLKTRCPPAATGSWTPPVAHPCSRTPTGCSPAMLS